MIRYRRRWSRSRRLGRMRKSDISSRFREEGIPKLRMILGFFISNWKCGGLLSLKKSKIIRLLLKNREREHSKKP